MTQVRAECPMARPAPGPRRDYEPEGVGSLAPSITHARACAGEDVRLEPPCPTGGPGSESEGPRRGETETRLPLLSGRSPFTSLGRAGNPKGARMGSFVTNANDSGEVSRAGRRA